MTLDHLPSLRDVIARFDLRAKKSLGQNFILDPGITDRIALAGHIPDGAHILEIGPGPGGLTRSLLKSKARKVTAAELDDRAILALSELQQAAGTDRLDILKIDAMKLDIKDIFTQGEQNLIIANLPYNISVPLLMNWLFIMAEHPGLITRMALMFQREVAERITALPRTPDYGRVSVIAQYLCHTQNVMTLPPGAFSPPPKVHSCVVQFTPRDMPADTPALSILDEILVKAFAQRRKMLRTNLKDYLNLLSKVGISETARAEEISVDQYIALAKIITQS